MEDKKGNKEKIFRGDFWSYFPGTKLGIFRKFLASFLLISILPLLIFGIYSYSSMSRVGKTSIERVRESIDEKTRGTLVLQAIQTAEGVKTFLENCESDLRDLALRPVSAKMYLEFYTTHKSVVWLPDGQGKSSPGIKKRLPLYKEISFVAPNGQEIVKIKDGKILPKRLLKNVRNPRNTSYLNEKYFARTIKLPPEEIYVSHLHGFFVTPKEQFPSKKDKELLKIGKYYDGVIRFAMPKYEKGKLKGILVLGLDHAHLMEFTQHLIPNSGDRVVFPDYNSGNYAFLFDDEGWIITHPKFWDIRGVDKSGNPVPPFTSHTPKTLLRKGLIPFNLDSAGFVHPNYPFVAKEVRKLNSGSVLTRNVGGTVKVMAYAPIIYNKGVYKKYGIFGGVTIGSEIHRFRGSANTVARELGAKIQAFRDDLIGFTIFTFLIVLIVAWFFSRSFSEPIKKLTETVKNFSEGDLKEISNVKRNDEIGVLSNSFNVMAYELKKSREKLLLSMKELERSRENAVRYAKDLEYQLKIFSAIQSISNLLGKTFDEKFIIKEILRLSVEAVGFDRAILYLLDEKGKYLECRDIYGFTEEEEKFARRSKYHIEHHDCIETRVLKKGEIIFVRNFKKYKDATETDRKINKISKSNSFVYVPLKIKEKTIGVLGADKLRTKRRIKKEEINSLQVFANQVSRVIENARLYQRIISQRNFVNDVFNNMLNGVLTTDGNGIVTSINDPARKILELNGKVTGESVYKIFPEYNNLLTEIEKALAESGVYKSYNQKILINGKVKYLNISVSRFEGKFENQIPTVTIIQDQTERKALEDHLHKIDRLASLGKFAAAIAHEIRNPLTGLSLFLDDIHDTVSDNPRLRETISRALDEIERLENLVNEILDFAAPSAKEMTSTDVNKLVNSTLAFVEKQAAKNGIEIKLELSEKIPQAQADQGKLRQALLNILLNAIQVQKEGGKILIKTSVSKSLKNISLESSKDRWITISIEDAGPGIPDELKNEIFEPFFSQAPDGTGLGLAIVHSIINEHRGHIFVGDSKLGGAKFSIFLPI